MEKSSEIKGSFSYIGNKYRIWKSHLSIIISKFSKVKLIVLSKI